ncbi:hypothetical protein [Aliarcobacter butzleri]|uniref:hypothetical protein n=2 Tax=Aliarcobacter butzleri TaxID=28197 RepID=UPI0021B30DC8|nr:hypothetical protein [Aliarcobacter butzleri]MCT7568498.1 hypothetical protein [Aliarcobacter butzleri]
MRSIQAKILPENWIKIVEKFDIEKSSLSDNSKIIATYLKPVILEEKEKSLNNSLLRIFINFIIFDIDFLVHYDNLPAKLIKDAFDEIKNERGINLDRKIHSLFVEFITYQDLYKQGYQIVDSTRVEGSCDLIMSKGDKTYNIEVKYKESSDVGKSRLYDYIDGYSLLKENEFLRKNFFEINLKVDSLNYTNLQVILEEIDIFINNKKDIYDGQNLQIFDAKKRSSLNRDISQASKYLNNFHIQIIDNVDRLINTILIERNGHITKLIKKSKKYTLEDNFIGCLVWSIPFHMDIDNDKIKQAFEKLQLNFDLFVYTGGFARDEFNFFVPKKFIEKHSTKPGTE